MPLPPKARSSAVYIAENLLHSSCMPKVGVHAIVVNDQGHVLLVKRAYLSRDWNVPGGIMEEGESIPEAAVREVLEEAGFLIKPKELVALASRPATNDVIIVLAAEIIEQRPTKTDSDEISEIGFFPFEYLPEPMRPEVKQLLQMFLNKQRGQLLEL